MYETIVRLFDTSQFITWVMDNSVLSVCIAILTIIAGYFFLPFVVFIFLYLRHKRLVWKWWILRGKHMSKRARNYELAEEVDDLLRDWVTKGKLTKRDRRRMAMNLEMALELERGDLTPRPNVHERKRRALGRLSADTANKFVEKVSAAAQPITKRLSSIIAGKA